VAAEELQDVVKRDTVASSIRFVDNHPGHEHAAVVLGAAADDLYEMKDYRQAIAAARRLVEGYPAADLPVRRAAWTVVAHASFDLEEYPQAEQAYLQVLASTAAGDESRPALVDNLAASVYRQGELANQAEDYRAAADHFLRVQQVAPTSTIRAAAEYDAGAALVRLQDWNAAARVFETFRSSHPGHELEREATKQIALVYRESGQLSRAAGEFDRIAAESEDPAMRGEALLVSGSLYEQSNDRERALDVYARYVAEFPRPVETAVETRFKIAAFHKAAGDDARYHEELAEIVRVDGAAGGERTARTRTVAARSALVLSEKLYREFATVQLLQPFEASLQAKQQLMDAVIQALNRLVEYEIAEVTAAATFYIAETYFEFSRALMESERPDDLQAAEIAEYELVLEEEAFPFEELAIGVHEKNLELMRAGVVNSWTENSLGKLAGLMPGRYAKAEMSTGFLDSIDSYAYRRPASLLPAPTAGAVDEVAAVAAAEPIQAAQRGPMAAASEGAEHAPAP
jgi:cellulose synthase operon protein C